jgi:cytochrome c oxidase assembly factor CtaG
MITGMTLSIVAVVLLIAGAPRWVAAAIAVGALGEGTGFATSTKALVVTSFAVLFAGLLPAVRTLRTATGPHPAAEPAIAVS